MSPERGNWFILLGVGLLSSAWCLTASRQLSLTFDEPLYIVQGFMYWHDGNRRDLLLSGVMPLSPHVQTLPLWISEIVTGRQWHWITDMAEIMTIARAANLVFLWLLLVFALRLGAAIGGPWAGRWAVMLLGFEPNILGHSSIATTDLSLTATLVAFVYYFREGRGLDWRRRVLIPGLVFTLPVLAKASAVMFGPLAMAGVELERLARGGAFTDLWRRTRNLRIDGMAVFAIGLTVAVVYCWTGGYPSFQTVLKSVPMDNPFRPIFAWFASLPLFPNGLYVLYFQIVHNVQGHATYLIGYESTESLWFYLPVMLSIKLPLATVLVIAASFAVPGRRWHWGAALGGLLIGISLIMRVDVGIRLLLPVVACVVIAAVARICLAMPDLTARSRHMAASALGIAVVWLALTDLRIWPDGIRYTNEAWGNTDRGYLYVSDSNYDWGQGLKELADWQREHGAPVKVWYFGQDPRFPNLDRFQPRTDDPATRIPQGGYFAAGTTQLYGGYSGDLQAFVNTIRAQTPVARTRTFLIFDRTDP